MAADKAWLLIRTDISRETDYVVFLNEHVAMESVGQSIGYLAQETLDTIEWDQEDADKLREILKDVAEKRWDDAVSNWDDGRSDKGPLDDDIEMVPIDLVT
jgi:hypothetical protein